MEPGRHHSLGRTAERLRGGRAETLERPDRARRPGARALLRDAVARAGGRADGSAQRRAASTAGPSPTVATDSALFAGLDAEQVVWMNHGDSVVAPPPGFRGIAADADDAARRLRERRAERVGDPVPSGGAPHRPRHARFSRTSSSAICGVEPNWTMENFRHEKVAQIRKQAPTGAVICALSGGVDSSVTAILLREALGDRVHPILVDHGLMRRHEREQVVEAFAQLGIAVHAVDASELFLARLAGVDRPGAEAQDHRAHLHRRVREGGADDSRRAIPRAGDALSGRHRVRLDQGPVRGHQDPPQRRRAAGAARVRADRARAGALQGRGAAARRGARAAAGVPRAAPVPRARASPCGSPARSRRSGSRCCRRRTRSSSRRSGAAGLYDAISQAFAVLLPVQVGGRDGRRPNARVRCSRSARCRRRTS